MWHKSSQKLRFCLSELMALLGQKGTEMSGIRCPVCDYDLDDCECEEVWGEDGRPSKQQEETIVGLFTQMGIDGEPVFPEVKVPANDQASGARKGLK